MRNLSQRKAAHIWLFLLLCFITNFLFRTLLAHPGHSMLGIYGDASKNYFTYLYHVLFGKGFVFEGMNYPFLEHIAYTDNQPLLSFPLSYLHHYFSFGEETALMLMNLFIPFSLIVSSIFLYKIFLHFKVHEFLAATVSICIVYLAPNIFRLFVHFGLSYSFYIIISLYYLLKYVDSKRTAFLIPVFLINFVAAFLHMYNMICILTLVFFFSIAYCIFDGEALKKKIRVAAIPILMILLCAISVLTLMSITDVSHDRTSTPWGFFEYLAHWEQVFTSRLSFLGEAFNLVFKFENGEAFNEGYSYLGFVPILFCIAVIFEILIYFLPAKYGIRKYSFSLHEKILLFTALFSLFISMGMPFTLGLEGLVDFLPYIKQFRSLGRVSIVSYFCIAICALIYIDRGIKFQLQQNNRKAAAGQTFFLLLFWTIDLFSYATKIQQQADRAPEHFQTFYKERETIKFPPNKYQCLMAMPYFYFGSDKIARDPQPMMLEDMYLLSLSSGLPMVNTYLARGSWGKTFDIMKVIGGPFADKKAFATALNEKPILIAKRNLYYAYEGERHLMQFARQVDSFKDMLLCELDFNKVISWESRYLDSLNRVALHDFDYSESIVNHFDEYKSQATFFGKGAYEFKDKDSLVLFDSTFPLFDEGQRVEFSCWFLPGMKDYRMPLCRIYFLDAKYNLLDNMEVKGDKANDFYQNWFRMNLEIIFKAEYRFMKIVLHNDDRKNCMAIDEMQIRKIENLTVFEDNSTGERLYNNHKVKK